MKVTYKLLNVSKKVHKFDTFTRREHALYICPLLRFIHSQNGNKHTQFGNIADEPMTMYPADDYMRGYAA